MRVGQEDLSRHRRRSEDPPPRRGWFWILLILVIGGGFVAYAQRALLLDYAKTFLAERIIVEQEPERANPEQEPNIIAEQELKPAQEPPTQQQPPGLDEGAVRQILSAQAQQQQQKIDELTKEVRYVGDVMRKLTASVAALQQSAKRESSRLRSIAARLEKMDTDSQAFGEQSTSDRSALNEAVDELRQNVATLQSSNDARAGRLDDLESTLSNFNTRLIDLER